MGCDIHLYVEVQREEDGPWERYGREVPYPYKYEGAPETEIESFYGGRNYTLFSILADVRNGRPIYSSALRGLDSGFAYDDRIEPIDEPRGLPHDVSPQVKEQSEYWGSDGHSHSYFTAYELLEVPWNERLATHRGYVTANEFYRFKQFGMTPETWSGDVVGGSIKKVSNAEMQDLIDRGEVLTAWTARKFGKQYVEQPMGTYYTMLEWTVPWSSSIGEFKDTMLRMANIAITECGGDLDRVRTVFWFDN